MKRIKIIFSIITVFILIAGCNEDETIPEVKLTLETNDPSSYGASDGAIDLSVSGLEDTPYEIFWNTGATDEDISGLKAGTYTVKVIYADKAVANKTAVLTEPAPEPLSLNFDVTPPSKWGYSNATIELDVSNGIPPYTFEWNTGSTEQNLENIKAGVYTVVITDSNPHNPVVTEGTVVILQPEFVCGRDSLIDVDGYRYPTVQLGDQCWTTVNLKTIHKPEWEPNNPAIDEGEFLIDGRYCDGLKCNNDMGAHYTWNAAMNGETSGEMVQGIAPDGWHIPSREEWKKLNDWLKVDGNGGDGTNVPNKIRGKNSPSGFDALYAGNWGYGVFTGDLAAFWTSTEYLDAEGNSTGEAYYRLINQFPLVGEGHDIKEKGLSVRLLLNE
mgnify:CR=1 FL=1